MGVPLVAPSAGRREHGFTDIDGTQPDSWASQA
jgi:hypothetical protein